MEIELSPVLKFFVVGLVLNLFINNLIIIIRGREKGITSNRNRKFGFIKRQNADFRFKSYPHGIGITWRVIPVIHRGRKLFRVVPTPSIGLCTSDRENYSSTANIYVQAHSGYFGGRNLSLIRSWRYVDETRGCAKTRLTGLAREIFCINRPSIWINRGAK